MRAAGAAPPARSTTLGFRTPRVLGHDRCRAQAASLRVMRLPTLPSSPRPRRDPRGRWSRRSCAMPPTTLRIYSLAARRPPSPFVLPPSPPLQRWPPPHAAPALQPWRPLTDFGAGSGYKSHSLPRPVCSFSDARLHACAERIRIYVEAVVLLCHGKANSVGP